MLLGGLPPKVGYPWWGETYNNFEKQFCFANKFIILFLLKMIGGLPPNVGYP